MSEGTRRRTGRGLVAGNRGGGWGCTAAHGARRLLLPRVCGPIAVWAVVVSTSPGLGCVEDTEATTGTTTRWLSASTATAPKVAMDVLWVVDHSPSMCEEQRQLGEAAPLMMARLASFDGGRIDVRTAAVTIQQAPDKTDIRVVGRFKHSPATAFPPNCFGRVKTRCLSDAHCGKPAPYTFGEVSDSSLCQASAPTSPLQTTTDQWKCKGPKAGDGSIKASATVNHNCSLNTYCEATCTKGAAGDALCQGLFGAKSQCSVSGGVAGVGGCIEQPDTQHCPTFKDLPPVLGDGQFDLLPCLTTVGAAQTQESKFEGAFRSAWMALDPQGPNCSYQACAAALRSCCVGDQPWCMETDPAVVAQNKLKCEADKVQLCEYLTPFGHCKRQIASCCEGPHDTLCTVHREPDKCAAAVQSQCAHLQGETDVVPQACQNLRLLRPDGYLVLVFISNNDECSMRMSMPDPDSTTGGRIALHPHDKRYMTKEIWEKCQIHNDVDLGNRVLMEARCEWKRDKAAAQGEAMYCPVDCRVGSKSKLPAGGYKCPGGCGEGSGQRAACLAKAQAQMDALDAQTRQGHSHLSPMEHLAGWQFAPVSEYAELFRSLKKRAGQVMVVGFGGDSMYGEQTDAVMDALEAAGKPRFTPQQEAQRHRDRVTYLRSKLVDIGPGQAPYACYGKFGYGEWGSRYIAMAEAFGDKGIVRNFCRNEDFAQVMPGIADRLYSQAADLCLPAPPALDKDGQMKLKVTRVVGDKTETLLPEACTTGGSPMAYCVRDAPHCGSSAAEEAGGGAPCDKSGDCPRDSFCVGGKCGAYRGAVHVIGGRKPGEAIEVSYDAVVWR